MEPKAVEMPMAMAKFRAIPTAAIPRPKKICASPNPMPKRISRDHWPADVCSKNETVWGIVAKVRTHGRMNIPHMPHTDQIFSHRHLRVIFVGTAKLPFKTPAMADKRTPIETPDMAWFTSRYRVTAVFTTAVVINDTSLVLISKIQTGLDLQIP
jgi:hypothetical protein